jgi:hypothetical protein
MTNAKSEVPAREVAPGESVYLKVGISVEEPLPVQEGGDWRMNIDKGNQGTDGKDARVIRTIANSSGQCSNTPSELKTVTGVPVAGGENVRRGLCLADDWNRFGI